VGEGRPQGVQVLRLRPDQEDEGRQFSAQDVIENVLADFEIMLSEFEKLSQLASEKGDTTTTALADANVEWLEKSIWMLKAHSN
jgi:starvation-inducible DNA-binding protein